MAFNQIKDRFPEHILEIYGDGELKNEIQNLINAYNLQKRIFLKGKVDNIHESISNSELFVLSSDYEGLSNALLEAMLMGIPVISTDCTGSNEYIIDGYNGLLVPVNNLQLLSSAMEKVLSSKMLQKSLSNNSKKIESKVSKKNVINLWYETLEKNENHG